MRIQLSASKVHNDFIRKVEEMSGQDLLKCYQCGECSAGCPAAFAMDILPNQVIRLLQLGEHEAVLKSKTIWLCAACQQCYTRCPKGVDLSRIMEVVRDLLMLEQGDRIVIEKIPAETLAEFPQQAFISGFRKYTA